MAALWRRTAPATSGSGPVLYVHTDGPARAEILTADDVRRSRARGRSGPIAHEPPLPVAGSVELELPVERLWDVFMDVPRWPEWNPCFRRASVDGGELRPGATLRFAFNPIRPPLPVQAARLGRDRGARAATTG